VCLCVSVCVCVCVCGGGGFVVFNDTIGGHRASVVIDLRNLE
jgi:hypothetical protein